METVQTSSPTSPSSTAPLAEVPGKSLSRCLSARRISALSALFASTLLLTACGGGDGRGGTPTVTNPPPIAHAGEHRTVSSGDAVTLDGSRSRDPEGGALTYSWRQTRGDRVVALSNSNTARPTFTAPEVTENTLLTYELVVTEPGGYAHADEVAITINVPPVASVTASTESVAAEGSVTLDGSASIDPGGTAITFQWTQVGDGPKVTLSDATTAKATFTAPTVVEDTILTFQLTVTDADGGTRKATIEVTVIGTGPAPSDEGDEPTVQPNRAPTAVAKVGPGMDAVAGPVTVTPGASVTLNGSESSDPDDNDTLSYAWTQEAPDMPVITLTDATTAMPTFTAPTLPANATFEFHLTVTDAAGLSSQPAEVSILVNLPPTAMATPISAPVAGGAMVELTGMGSDAGGGAVTYRWEQTGGPTVTLTGATTANASFSAPSLLVDTVLTFEFTVTDTDGTHREDTVMVTVAGADLSEMRSVSVSDDGTRAVVGDIDGNVRLLDATTGSEIALLGSHHGPVYAVAISGDGSRAISGGHDGAVKLWNTGTAAIAATDDIVETAVNAEIRYKVMGSEEGRSLREAGIWVYAVALDEDGDRAASGGFDGQVRLWNTGVEEAPAIATVRAAADPGDEIVYSFEMPAENMDATLGPNLFDLGHHINVHEGPTEAFTDDTYTRSLGSHGSAVEEDNGTESDDMDDRTLTTYYSVYAVSLNDDGDRVLSGGADGAVRVWDADTGMELGNGLTDDDDMVVMGPVYGVALSGDGTVAVAGGADNKVRVWNIGMDGTGDEQTHELDVAMADGEVVDGADVSSVSLDAANIHVLSSSGNGYVHLWGVGPNDPPEGTEMFASRHHTGSVWSASLSGNGSRVLSVGDDSTDGMDDRKGELNIWQTDTPPADTDQFSITQPDTVPAAGGTFLPDDVVRRELPGVDLPQAAVTANAPAFTYGSCRVRDVELSEDGKLLLTGGNQCVLRDESNTPIHTYTRRVSLWNVADLTEVSFNGSSVYTDENAIAVDLNADGRIAMVVGESFPRVHFLNTESDNNADIETIRGHLDLPDHDWTNTLSATPDGHFVATKHGSRPDAWVWDLSTGRNSGETDDAAHSNVINSLALSANGKTLLTGAAGSPTDQELDERNVVLWDIGQVPKWGSETSLGHTANFVYGFGAGEPGRQMYRHADAVEKVAVSAKGDLVLSAEQGEVEEEHTRGAIFLWETKVGGEQVHRMAHYGLLITATLSANGRIGLSAGGRRPTLPSHNYTGFGTIRLWDMATGKLLRVMEGHTVQIVTASLSADGRVAATGQFHGRVFLWHLGGSRTIHPLFELTAEAGLNLPAQGEDPIRAGDTVTLTGSGVDESDKESETNEPIAYYWRQVPTGDTTLDADNTVTFRNSPVVMVPPDSNTPPEPFVPPVTTPTVTFVVPATLTSATTLTFELTVTSAMGLIATDTVTVEISP